MHLRGCRRLTAFTSVAKRVGDTASAGNATPGSIAVQLDIFEFPGTNRNDCGFKEQPNGNTVTAIEQQPPHLGIAPYWMSIFHQPVKLLRNKRGRFAKTLDRRFFNEAFGSGFIISIIFNYIQFILIERRFNQPQQEQS